MCLFVYIYIYIYIHTQENGKTMRHVTSYLARYIVDAYDPTVPVLIVVWIQALIVRRMKDKGQPLDLPLGVV